MEAETGQAAGAPGRAHHLLGSGRGFGAGCGSALGATRQTTRTGQDLDSTKQVVARAWAAGA